MQEIDLLIIGSGPAGLSTALHLLQQDSGWAKRMILVDKASHPRPKLCAGGVTRIGLKTLRDLEIQLPLPIPVVEVEEARLVYKNSQIRFRRKPVFVVYNRIEFDAYLSKIARQRGIVIHEDEVVQAITSRELGMEVKTDRDRYLAQVVIGADGSKGVTRRYLSTSGSQGTAARVLETIYPADVAQEPFTEALATFDFTWCEKDLQGYSWAFPSRVNGKPHINLGVYDSQLAPGRNRADLPDILKRSIVQDKHLSKDLQIQGHPVLWFNPSRCLSSSRFLLVGDAAGVDSLFGEGIGPALTYGKLAAQEINTAFDREDFSFKWYKFHLLISPLGRFLLFRWMLAWLSYRLSWIPIYMHTLWAVGKMAAVLWTESEWFYPPNSLENIPGPDEKN